MNVQQLHAQQMAKLESSRGSLTGSGDANPSDGFDPSTASVSAVMDWVALHPDMASSVLEAERSGRARVGIVRILESRIESGEVG